MSYVYGLNRLIHSKTQSKLEKGKQSGSIISTRRTYNTEFRKIEIELADMLNIQPRQLRAYARRTEADRKPNLTLLQAKKIAEYFKVNIEELVKV